ncbi:hypothetical protein BGW39_003475 [Mortierella sp. 14UC]|nr:hypothetical protein BGW39_003475 [Mortierella sp. 14UC]
MADSSSRTADGSDIHSCPICHDPFHGDHAAFENHVNSHFADEQEEQSPLLHDDTPDSPKHSLLHQVLDKVVLPRHSEPIHVPNTPDPGPSTTLDTEDDFKIPCEAKDCYMMVHIRDMAEHMDMHLAEQIQGHSTKRAYEPDDSPPDKRTRINSAESSRSVQEPVKEEKRTGQTTMDGFFTHSPREPKTPSNGPSSPTQSRLSFVQEPPASLSSIGVSGLIDKTRILLETSLAQGVTQQAFLADPSVIFFQSDKTDRGWGCGYRNIQMMLSYVVGQTETTPSSAAAADNIPMVPDLQRQLEYAWSNGFDAQGAGQLGHKVEGTKKWIGTTEAWSVLCSLGVRCSILDFHMPSGPDGTHPAMFAAIYNYFCSPDWSPLSAPLALHVDDLKQWSGRDNRIIQTAKPPLYMQHQGHSRTIVGIEILKEDRGMNLLVFDPNRWLHDAIPTLKREAVSQSLSPSSGSKAVVAADKKLDAQYLLKAFRLQVGAGFAKAQYQLLGISGLYNEDKERSTAAAAGGSRSRSSHRSPSLQLFARYPSLSVGWTEEEHENSKSVTSTRVP